MAIKYTKHAEEMLILRDINKNITDQVVNNPDKISPTREGLKIYLKNMGKNYLMLVVVEEDEDKIVVTLH